MGVNTSATYYSIAQRNWSEFWEAVRLHCPETITIEPSFLSDGFLYGGEPHYDYSVGDYSEEQTKQLAEIMKQHEIVLIAVDKGLYEGIQVLAAKKESLTFSI